MSHDRFTDPDHHRLPDTSALSRNCGEDKSACDPQGGQPTRIVVWVECDDEDDSPVLPSRGNRWRSPDDPSAWRDPEFVLEHQSLAWEWLSRHASNGAALRSIARILRALEESGFIERITIRQHGAHVRRIFRLTEPGIELAELLTGSDLPKEWTR